MSLGPSEILVVLLVALIVLGPDKLPQAARTLGKFIHEIRKLSAAVQSQVDDVLKMPGETTDEPENAEQKPKNPDVSGFTLIDESARKPVPPQEDLDKPDDQE